LQIFSFFLFLIFPNYAPNYSATLRVINIKLIDN